MFLSQTKKVLNDSLCPSENSKGLWNPERPEHPPSNPPEIRTHSLFEVAQVVTPKSRQPGSLVTFVALVPISGARLQYAGYLPPLRMPSCLSTADMNSQGALGKAGSISQLSKGRRGSGSVLLLDTLTPTQEHTCTKPPFVSCVVTLGWRGEGQSPSVGKVRPKLCKGCVAAACTSRGCKRARN